MDIAKAKEMRFLPPLEMLEALPAYVTTPEEEKFWFELTKGKINGVMSWIMSYSADPENHTPQPLMEICDKDLEAALREALESLKCYPLTVEEMDEKCLN